MAWPFLVTVTLAAAAVGMSTAFVPTNNLMATEIAAAAASLTTMMTTTLRDSETRKSSKERRRSSIDNRFVALNAVSTDTTTSGATKSEESDDSLLRRSETKDVVTTVAVTGATGRTGRLVVQELMDKGVQNIVAVVRSEETAKDVFPDVPSNLSILPCDLNNERELKSVLNNVDAVIWCATGFSNKPGDSTIQKKQSIDTIGLPLLAKCLKEELQQQEEERERKEEDKMIFARRRLPKVVLLSSAGVTRTQWDEEKVELLKSAADIPILRLNPFGILDIKRESEELLRKTGVDYCIVRPAGLNDDQPSGSRVIISQGDVAVGRINRADVAQVLVEVLGTPEATGKTCEIISIAAGGYSPARSLRPVMAQLLSDAVDGTGPPLTPEAVQATYSVLQQLLPGEKQESSSLALGQTYEQLDKGEVGRFGEKGKENLSNVTIKPSS